MNIRKDLAVAYHSAGDLVRANELFEDAVTDRARVLGESHPDTLNSRNNLALACFHAGDRPRVVELFELALTGMTRTFGANHPNTLSVHDNYLKAHAIARGGIGILGWPSDNFVWQCVRR